MTWHAVYDAATGRLHAIGSGAPPALPEGYAALELAGQPDLSAFEWNAVTRSFAARAPEPRTVLSRIEFRSRFTIPEQVQLDLQSIGPTVEAATLRVLAANWAAANDIDLTDPRVQEGVGALVQYGILTPERAAEILAPELGDQ